MKAKLPAGNLHLHHEVTSSVASNLEATLPSSLKHSMVLAQENGALSWLFVIPREEFGFILKKGAFRDALALRYGRLPSLSFL